MWIRRRDLRLVGLRQRLHDDLSRVLLLQLPHGLLGGPPGQLLSQPGRLQTLLLESLQKEQQQRHHQCDVSSILSHS